MVQPLLLRLFVFSRHFNFPTQHYHLQTLGRPLDPLFSFWLYLVNPCESRSFPAANASDLCLGFFCHLLTNWSWSPRGLWLCPCALTIVPLVGRARAIHPLPVDTTSSELASRGCRERATDPPYFRDRVLGLSLLAREEKAKLNILAQLQFFAAEPMQLPMALWCGHPLSTK